MNQRQVSLLAAMVIATFLLLNLYGLGVRTITDKESHAGGWEVPISKNNSKVLTSSSPFMAVNQTLPTRLPRAPRLYHCGGYALNRNFQPTLQSLLPEYEWNDLRAVVDLESWQAKDMLETYEWDIFVSNYQLNDCKDTAFNEFHLHFGGKVLFWTPEDGRNYVPLTQRPNYFFLGPGAPKMTLSFLQTAFWAQVPEEDKQAIFLRHRPRQNLPTSDEVNAKEFLIYAHSNCIGERQKAFRLIAKAPNLPPVHFGGKCNGNMKNQTGNKVSKYPNKVKLANWEDNRYIYQHFRFCLTMEHASTPGYLTEKILVAFWAGCIPVYWGVNPDEIHAIFDKRAMIYWNISDPEPALTRLQYLEQNRTAYLQALAQPILAPGAIRAYFSLGKGVGDGDLKRRIREYLGIDAFLPF